MVLENVHGNVIVIVLIVIAQFVFLNNLYVVKQQKRGLVKNIRPLKPQ